MSEYNVAGLAADAPNDNISNDGAQFEGASQSENNDQFKASIDQLEPKNANPLEALTSFVQEKTKDINFADVGRTVAIAGIAGLTVAAAAPLIAGAGLVGAGAVAASSVLGAATGFTAGRLIDLGDAVGAEATGSQRHFQKTDFMSDALLGGSTGLNIGAMNAFHPMLEAIPAKVLGAKIAETSVGKIFDIGAHTIGHIAIDSAVESARQITQGVSEGKSFNEIGKDWKLAMTATAPASIASTFVVEFMESKIKGSRPFLMSMAEGGEAATRSGAVKGLQMADSGSQLPKDNPKIDIAKTYVSKNSTPINSLKTYTVSEGETLEGIANKELGTPDTVTQIIALNRLSNPDLIFSGQKLNIPTKDTTQLLASL